jgi:hypothetical protein
MKLIPVGDRHACVDDEDFERISVYNWKLYADVKKSGTNFYARRSFGKHGGAYMHQDIMGIRTGVDHRDHDGLNNQRHNLRMATNSQNGANKRKWIAGTSRYKGVHKTTRAATWRASIKHNGKNIHIGSFKREENAAQAYNFVADELFGEFAYLNIPLARVGFEIDSDKEKERT